MIGRYETVSYTTEYFPASFWPIRQYVSRVTQYSLDVKPPPKKLYSTAINMSLSSIMLYNLESCLFGRSVQTNGFELHLNSTAVWKMVVLGTYSTWFFLCVSRCCIYAVLTLFPLGCMSSFWHHCSRFSFCSSCHCPTGNYCCCYHRVLLLREKVTGFPCTLLLDFS